MAQTNPVSGTSMTPRVARATLEEGQLFARYLNCAAEGFFRFLLGSNYVHILANAYRQPDHDLSYQNVTFAEVDGAIVGMFSGFTAEAHLQADKSVLPRAAGSWNLGFRLKSMLFSPLTRIIDNINENDFYLQAIAVDDSLRGRGIGSKLLELAEQTALQKGNTGISLDVSADNKTAFQLYEKCGYVVESSWPKILRLPAIRFFRMRKDLLTTPGLETGMN